MMIWDNDRRYDIYNALHEILYNILVHGKNNQKDDANIKEYLGNYIRIKNPYPQYNTKGKFTSSDFIKSIQDGRYDLDNYGLKGEALADYVSSLMDESHIKLDNDTAFVYTYPNRLQYQSANVNDTNVVNQIEILCNRLIYCKNTNRAVATIYNPFLDAHEEDIPCLQWIQITIRDDKMRLHCIFRSNDIYGAWYGNMLFLTYLALLILEIINRHYEMDNTFIEFEGIDYYSTSAHVYMHDLDSALKLFKEVGI